MKPSEKKPFNPAWIQAAIAFLTLLAAVWIGRSQMDISRNQMAISQKQAEISKSLLDIPFTLSVDVTYEDNTKHLNIYNKGATNVYLWGTKLGTGPTTMDPEPRLITPGGFYYILADTVERDTLAKIPKDGEARGNLHTYLTSQNGTKYVVTTILFAKVSSGKCTIHTQTTSIKPQEW